MDEDFECPVCLETKYNHIICKNKHKLCKLCFQLLKGSTYPDTPKCPVCRIVLFPPTVYYLKQSDIRCLMAPMLTLIEEVEIKQEIYDAFNIMLTLGVDMNDKIITHLLNIISYIYGLYSSNEFTDHELVLIFENAFLSTMPCYLLGMFLDKHTLHTDIMATIINKALSEKIRSSHILYILRLYPKAPRYCVYLIHTALVNDYSDDVIEALIDMYPPAAIIPDEVDKYPYQLARIYGRSAHIIHLLKRKYKKRNEND